MKHMPSRDVSGCCTGECRDLVHEGEVKRQREISSHKYTGDSSPSLPWASSRSEQPGFYGGHV